MKLKISQVKEIIRKMVLLKGMQIQSLTIDEVFDMCKSEGLTIDRSDIENLLLEKKIDDLEAKISSDISVDPPKKVVQKVQSKVTSAVAAATMKKGHLKGVKHVFDVMDDSHKFSILFEAIQELKNKIFELEQKVEYFEKQTDIRLTKEEILQRKDVWSKSEVMDYFGISSKTFERHKKTGDLPVFQLGGKDFCSRVTLKEKASNQIKDLAEARGVNLNDI